MSISYAGVPLLYPDGEMFFNTFVDDHLPLMQEHVIGPTQQSMGASNDPLGANKPPTISGPAYPPKPRLRFNELYWPTGAGRWAEGYFLCSFDAAMEIGNKAGTTAQPLRMMGGGGMSVDMFLLPPRPLTGIIGKTVWCLPLVDERYFWQFQAAVGSVISDNYSSIWLELISGLFGDVGVTSPVISTVHADYGVPEPAVFVDGFNPAVMLDAAAHSIGHRIVRQIDGTSYSYDWADSETAYFTNAQQQFTVVAGDEFSAAFPLWQRPSYVRVYFPIVNGCGMYSKIGELQPPTNGKTKTIISFAGGLGSSPSNSATLDKIAARVTADLESSLKYRYARTFSGVQPWSFSGYDDHALFQFSQKPNGEYVCQTRVMSPPYNFGVEEMYHALTAAPTFPGHDHLIGKLDGTLSQGGSATVSVWDGTPGSESDTGLNVTAYDWLMKSGATAIASGKKVFLTRICGYWYATNAECA